MDTPSGLAAVSTPVASRQPVALGETSGPPHLGDSGPGGGETGGGTPDEDALQARLDALRRG